MVTAWNDLGFIKYVTKTITPTIKVMTEKGCKTEKQPPQTVEGYYQVERNDKALGPPIKPGKRLLGVTKQSERKDG